MTQWVYTFGDGKAEGSSGLRNLLGGKGANLAEMANLAAGIGAESDKSVLARCLARWAATSYGGAASAYRQWVNDAFVAIAQTNTINRIGVDDTNPNGPGSTDIYLANAGGPAGLTELAVVSPFLLARRGLGTGPLRIFAAPSIAIPVIATLYGNTGGAALGAAALASLQAEIPLGGKVYFSALLSLLKDIPGVYNVAMTSPAPGVDTTLPSFDVATFVPTLVALA